MGNGMRTFASGFILAMGLLCQTLHAEDLVLYTLHLPPHMIDSSVQPSTNVVNKKHNVYGLDVDLVRAAYASQGVTVHFEVMPWKRIMRNIEAGLILGAVSCRPLPSRKKFAFFSQEVSESVSVLVTRRDYLEANAHTLASLNGHKTVAVNGWSQTNILDNAHVPYTRVSGLEQGFNLILRRNQDVFMTERDGARFEAKLLGIADQLSFYDVSNLDNQHYAVCLSKKYPGAEKWRDTLDKGLDELKVNGEWNAILARYGLVAPAQ